MNRWFAVVLLCSVATFGQPSAQQSQSQPDLIVMFAQRGGARALPADVTPWEWVEPARLDPVTADRLFTLYDSASYGEFQRAIGTLAHSLTNPFEFEADAVSWIGAGPDLSRRSFVAAAVAMELAAAQRPRQSLDAPSIGRELTTLHLNFVLAEVGCAFLRDHPRSPAERSWHAAFVALARAYDREDHVTTPPRVHGVDADRALAKKNAHDRKEVQNLMRRVRKAASRTSRTSRIDMANVRAEHTKHLTARLRGDPLPAFLNAVVQEKALAVAGVAETLLPGARSPVLLDSADVARLANGGRQQVKTMRSNHRTDRASAERVYQSVPELNTVYDPANRVFRDRPVSSSQPNGVAISLALWDIVDAFRALDAGTPFTAEAALRLGRTYSRLARPDLALSSLVVAEAQATSPYEQYLARLFAGALFEHAGRRTEAIGAFRSALQVVPQAQSASLALAPLLLERDEAAEAAAILAAAMKLPLAEDPLLYYFQGDPAGVARALAQLRREALR
jgi:hypothetical protein